jgi:hypothetical protein
MVVLSQPQLNLHWPSFGKPELTQSIFMFGGAIVCACE